MAGLSIVSSAESSGAASWFRRAAGGIFAVLFPSNCRICGEPQLNISRLPVCSACLDAIEAISGRVCSVCGEAVLSTYALADASGFIECPVCRRVERPYERAVAYGSYEDGVRELVHLLKYEAIRPASEVLGRMLAEAMAQFLPEIGHESVLVVPVPLFKGKRNRRGFNQAELIARAALKRLSAANLRLETGALERTRETESQIGLTSHQRRENLRGAFAIVRAAEVTGKAVLVVDDVYTTGTTVSECARVLRRAGASKVWVATVARTMKQVTKLMAVQAGESSEQVLEPVVGN